MEDYNWIEFVDSGKPRQWVEEGNEWGIRVAPDPEKDDYSVFLQYRRHLPAKNVREIGRYDQVEAANRAAEEIVGSEELEELLETAGEFYPDALENISY